MKPRFFGQFLIEKDYLTQQQLFNGLEYQREHMSRIGEIAIQKGYMTTKEVEKIVLEQRRTDKLFGEIAILTGLLNFDRLETILTIQKFNHVYLGEALVEAGFLSKGQMDMYLNEYHKEQRPLASLAKTIPDELEIKDEVFIMLDIAVKIFRRMANLLLKVGTGNIIEDRVKNLYAITSIHFTGCPDMRFLLNLPKEIADEITKNLYNNRDIVCYDFTVCDCVGEVTNIICGNSSSYILEHGKKYYISPPGSILCSNEEFFKIQDGKKMVLFPSRVPIGDREIGIEWTSKQEKDEMAIEAQKENYSVLIADDSGLSRRKLMDIIDNLDGFEVVGVAENGAKAIGKYQELKPDVIFVDLIMPEIPGEEVIRRIRAMNESAKIVIVSSIGGAADTIYSELGRGGLAVISKPISEASVINALKKAIEE